MFNSPKFPRLHDGTKAICCLHKSCSLYDRINWPNCDKANIHLGGGGFWSAYSISSIKTKHLFLSTPTLFYIDSVEEKQKHLNTILY